MKKYTIFVGNRNDGKKEVTLDELIPQFKVWLESKEKGHLAYYCMNLVQMFVGAADGLNATADSEDIEQMAEDLKDTKWDYLNSIGIK